MEAQRRDPKIWKNKVTDFTQRLEKACKRLDIPIQGRQQRISEGTGCTKEAARKWLKGQSRPSRKAAAKLAAFLKVDQAWLEFGGEQFLPQPAQQIEMIKAQKEAAFYLIFAYFKMANFPLVLAKDEQPEDFFVLQGVDLIPVAVATAEEKSDRKYTARINPNISDESVVIVVIPSEDFGKANFVALRYDQVEKLSRKLPDCWELDLVKQGAGTFTIKNVTFKQSRSVRGVLV